MTNYKTLERAASYHTPYSLGRYNLRAGGREGGPQGDTRNTPRNQIQTVPTRGFKYTSKQTSLKSNTNPYTAMGVYPELDPIPSAHRRRGVGVDLLHCCVFHVMRNGKLYKSPNKHGPVFDPSANIRSLGKQAPSTVYQCKAKAPKTQNVETTWLYLHHELDSIAIAPKSVNYAALQEVPAAPDARTREGEEKNVDDATRPCQQRNKHAVGQAALLWRMTRG